MDFKKHEEILTQFVRKLVNADYDLAKQAACAIIPSLYSSMVSLFEYLSNIV